MIATDTERKEPVTLVLEEALPVRVDWDGVRYYVDAPPEPRGMLVARPQGADPDPTMVTGWRIRASSADGELHVFDVTSCPGARWWLTRLDS